MKRWLLNIVCLLAFLLWVASVGVWLRSYFVADQFLVHSFESVPGGTYWTYYHLEAGQGGVGFNRLGQSIPWTPDKFESHTRKNWPQPFHRTQSARYPNFRFGLGKNYWGVEFFHVAAYDHSAIPNWPRAKGYLIIAPFWELLLALTLIGSPFWIYWYRTRTRHKAGHCPHCGYDLRASPEQCPECGKPTSTTIAQPRASPAR